jgi:Adaptin N terminal region
MRNERSIPRANAKPAVREDNFTAENPRICTTTCVDPYCVLQCSGRPSFLATMAVLENAYSLVHQDNAADLPSQQELKTQLEKGTDETKVETMKRILTIMLNGDSMPNLLMHIIRFVMPSKSKPLKKLLYFYYEICPKLDSNRKLKQEMILVWYVPRDCYESPTI